MIDDRHLDWPGCFNVRDLGGLPAAGGRETARGAVVRADALERLEADGWAALLDHGVRTVIDLRNPEERRGDHAARPPGLTTLELPLDGARSPEFWAAQGTVPQFGSPMHYRAHLQRYPERSAAVIAAVARAEPGGVVFHCVAGRDRSGQIAMLMLALVGVDSQTIAADYLLSHERLRGLFAAVGEPDQGPMLEAQLAERGTTAEEVIAMTLSSLDVEATLRAGGLTDEDLAALRARLLAPGSPGAGAQ